MLSKTTLKILAYTWLPLLRLLEFLKIHNYRQNFPIGFVKVGDITKVKVFLIKKGYEENIFAWRDPGEVVDVRKTDEEEFRYHLRIFEDGEVRGHYEYNGEVKPLKHIFEACFVGRESYFRGLLRKWLVSSQ